MSKETHLNRTDWRCFVRPSDESVYFTCGEVNPPYHHHMAFDSALESDQKELADRFCQGINLYNRLRNAAPIVIVESPYAGDIETNKRYLRAALRDSLKRGEAPYASHAIYTQPNVLNDLDPVERKHGIEAGFVFRLVAKETVVYTDLGMSSGMEWGIKHSQEIGVPVSYRSLKGWKQ